MNSLDIKIFKNVLEEEIKSSSKVFLVGHNGPDFDSIASCIGLSLISSFFNKESYIIVDDAGFKLEPGVKKIIDDNNEVYNFIKKQDYLELVDKESILIITDTSKTHMISISDYLNKVKSIIIIDHHNEDEHTIKTDKKLIMHDASSASEIVARLIGMYKVKLNEDVANFLLAGIDLDTKRFKHNTTAKTHNVAKWLIDNGANIDTVNNLFLEEFDSFCRISTLIINGTIIKKYSEDLLSPIQVSFTYNRNSSGEIYAREDYAKAADQMMRFNGVDASFVLGYIDKETIHISARSNKKVNVGRIMECLDGGGTNQSAGGTVKSDDILKVEEKLMEFTPVGISKEEDIIHPQTIKVQQLPKKKN